MIIAGGLAAAVAVFLIAGHDSKPRPTMADQNSWYAVHNDTSGAWETVGPKDGGDCHWLRASKPNEDLEDWIDVGRWDLQKTSGGTMHIPIRSGEWFIYWGCYPFHFDGP